MSAFNLRTKCIDCKNDPCILSCYSDCITHGYKNFKQKEEEIEPNKLIDISKDSENSEVAKDVVTDKDIADKLDKIIELLEHLVNEFK